MTDWTDLPVLRGSRLRLDPMTVGDADGLLAAADDDEVFTWLWTPRPRTREDALGLVAGLADMPGVHPWTQREVATGRVVGMTTFYDVSRPQRSLAIGYTWLSRARWGSGLNTEAKLLQLTHAFDGLGCVRVVWHIDALNLRSQAAVERLGATREGLLRKHKQRRDGSWRDTVLYAMLDSEWPAAREELLARQPSAATSGRSAPK